MVKEYIFNNYMVSAIQYDGSNIDSVKKFSLDVCPGCKFEENKRIKLTTDHGLEELKISDYIVSDVLGNFYKLSKKTFEKQFVLREKNDKTTMKFA